MFSSTVETAGNPKKRKRGVNNSEGRTLEQSIQPEAYHLAANDILAQQIRELNCIIEALQARVNDAAK